MLAINLESEVDRPDFVALDKEGQIILIAEVKGNPFDSNIEKRQKKMLSCKLLSFCKRKNP